MENSLLNKFVLFQKRYIMKDTVKPPLADTPRSRHTPHSLEGLLEGGGGGRRGGRHTQEEPTKPVCVCAYHKAL